MFDANGDGERDIVVTTCSGTHVVSWRGAIVESRVNELGPGWWGRQVLDGGTELIVVGVLLGFVGLGMLAIAARSARPAGTVPGSVKKNVAPCRPRPRPRCGRRGDG